MQATRILYALAGLLLAAAPAMAQQAETGPAATGAPALRSGETGTRGPSGGSPETGYHGPRDVTADVEPGKKKSPEEMRRGGQSPEESGRAN